MKIRDLLIKLRIKQIDDKIILLIFAIKDKKYNFWDCRILNFTWNDNENEMTHCQIEWQYNRRCIFWHTFWKNNNTHDYGIFILLNDIDGKIGRIVKRACLLIVIYDHWWAQEMVKSLRSTIMRVYRLVPLITSTHYDFRTCNFGVINRFDDNASGLSEAEWITRDSGE